MLFNLKDNSGLLQLGSLIFVVSAPFFRWVIIILYSKKELLRSGNAATSLKRGQMGQKHKHLDDYSSKTNLQVKQKRENKGQ